MNPEQGSDTVGMNDAAAQAAGRGLATAVLQRNPIVAVAAALLGPILGLFRRRGNPPPMAVNKVRLESYSKTPYSQTQPASATHQPGISQPAEQPRERPKMAPNRWRSRPPAAEGRPTRRLRPHAVGAARQEGGSYHG